MWKDIKNYEDLYQINEHGKVRRENKILKTLYDSNGYSAICLCKNGVPKRYRIHRLVAETFVPRIEGKNTVNHKDGNRTNPHVDNLEWCTMSENHKHAFRELGKVPNRGMKGRFGKAHNRSKSFRVKMKDGSVKDFGSGLEFKRRTELDHTSISWAAKNKHLPYTFTRGRMKGITLCHFEII